MKAPTGIQGLDEITGGGLPKGRPTLLCGGTGCGKTLLAMEFLLRGAAEYDEPGVFMAFEERTEELTQNFASLGHNLDALVAEKMLAMEFVHIDRSEIQETGDYDLEGLFIRLGFAIDRIGAKRVVLDTLESLFSGFSNVAILRSELRRLFVWLKDRGVTAIVTGERGENSLTRYGLEEYVADCVILLDHRVADNMATRRMRIVKYRGSYHGTSEYPFLIDEGGISFLPVTSIGLRHEASVERISSGVPQLDAMMGGKGYFRGSSVLVSGTAGAGKTSLAAHFIQAAVARGERCIWFAFEESPSQIMRNMRSIGIDLEPALRQGLLRFRAERPSMSGLEMHLVTMHKLVNEFKPQVVVIDPVNNLTALGSEQEIRAMLIRVIDLFKVRQISALFTSLTSGGGFLEATSIGVSSLMDSWLLLRDMESGNERNRVLHLLKSRGMAHSNQVREFLLTQHGVELRDVYLGASGLVLTGSARLAQETQEAAAANLREQEEEYLKLRLERNRKIMETQIAAVRAEHEVQQADLMRALAQSQARTLSLAADRLQMGRLRQADAGAANRQTQPKKGNAR